MSYSKISLLIGSFIASICIANYLIVMSIGLNPILNYHMLDFLFAVIFLSIGIFMYKSRRGYLHFWEGLLVGFYSTVIYVLFYASFIVTLMSVKPNLLQQHLNDLVVNEFEYKNLILKNHKIYLHTLDSLKNIKANKDSLIYTHRAEWAILKNEGYLNTTIDSVKMAGSELDKIAKMFNEKEFSILINQVNNTKAKDLAFDEMIKKSIPCIIFTFFIAMVLRKTEDEYIAEKNPNHKTI